MSERDKVLSSLNAVLMCFTTIIIVHSTTTSSSTTNLASCSTPLKAFLLYVHASQKHTTGKLQHTNKYSDANVCLFFVCVYAVVYKVMSLIIILCAWRCHRRSTTQFARSSSPKCLSPSPLPSPSPGRDQFRDTKFFLAL